MTLPIAKSTSVTLSYKVNKVINICIFVFLLLCDFHLLFERTIPPQGFNELQKEAISENIFLAH